ncbi:MAG: fluoride efflux transporter CrcB [Thermoguttaceae bacterium]
MINILKNCVLVGIGGFAGSALRYLFSFFLQRFSVVLPAGTLTANLLGCFLIGVISQLSMPAGLLSPEARLTLAVGFCGGLTTASTLIYETAQYFSDGEYFHASLYLLGTLFGSLLAFYIGVILVKIIFKSTGAIWN